MLGLCLFYTRRLSSTFSQKMWLTRKRKCEHRDELVALLERAKGHIDSSEESIWAGLSPAESGMDLTIAIEALRNNEAVDRDQLRMHFAPTGPLQETSMMSGWTDEYMEISSHFDALIDQV